MGSGPVITRFAPAPTGFLHLGHVFNAIHVWDVARARGGDGLVLLRIEDPSRAAEQVIAHAATLGGLSRLR